RKRPRPLEEYLAEFPELAPAAADTAELIYEEYRARQRYGDRPALDSYRERFPQQFERLSELLEKRPIGTLNASDNTTAAETPPAAAAPTAEVIRLGGGYTLLAFIDKGEYGEVFRALAPGGVEVAVKRIFRPATHAASQREHQALELIKSLRHPYLL